MLLTLLICFLLLVLVSQHHRSLLFAGLVVIVLIEAYGLYRIVQHDYDLCRDLGYICPFCQKPLYEARAGTHLNGLCPKCGKSILPVTQQAPC